jgi:hypothetical protein
VRDLNFSKIQAELLASRLQRWYLIQRGVKCHTENVKIVIAFFLMTAS